MDRTKLEIGTGAMLAIGAAVVLLVLMWIIYARSDEEIVSSSGFRDGDSGSAASPFSPERRSQTGLDFVRLGAAAPPPATRPEPLQGAAPASSDAAAANAAGAAEPPAVDPRELAEAGLPTRAEGLQRLGAKDGLLTDAVDHLLNHPSVLRALFNNKMVVDALMDRDSSKKNCSDSSALQSVLSNPNSGPVAEMLPLIKRVLSHPDVAAAFAGSEMGSRLMSCPSVKGLASNPTALASVAMANPDAISFVTDPRVTQALAGSQQGTALLSGVQLSVAGGAAP